MADNYILGFRGLVLCHRLISSLAKSQTKGCSLWELLAPDFCLKLAFVLFLLAGPECFICRNQHFCMAEHGRHFQSIWPI
jgi:hypothetical protein